MIRHSPALTARGAEIAYLREQALGDAIMAAEGTDSPELRLVAAQLAAAHRVLSGEATRRSLAGESRARICVALGQAAESVFGLLEPSIGAYGTPAETRQCGTPPVSDSPRCRGVRLNSPPASP